MKVIRQKVDHHGDEDDPQNIRNNPEQELPEIRVILRLELAPQDDKGEDAAHDAEDSDEKGVDDQEHEGLSVLETDAVAEPRTVVVHHEDAALACAAVMGSFGFENLADQAVSVVNLRLLSI